ncbi:NAD(P)-dependent oxidoreductase [Actinomycetospora sp. TBRC 11914]|uniref:NAD(P)-dependent oxidoreductase n=1 Tax=Actinomycetospora sp. TBRC 11914 TaxID=2729387 RepID=UPI00145CB10B|nr:NAD(P)-dependent oxidoreductase [Actinomycetospora sp. TBRC 11914]NMO89540.1 NAD(P)-dependent oxidoreductase [Actinomycetospora sp. TBRC 11914]
MTTVGVVAPGAMGVALGRCFAAGGHDVLMTAAGRSAATARRLAEAGIDDAGSIDAVTGGASVVISVVPPAQARATAEDIAAGARRTGAHPLLLEANAVAPATVADVAATVGAADLDVVDAAISGPPPRPDAEQPTRIFLAGPRAHEIGALGVPGVRWVGLAADLGAASAAKMCTASVRKGHQALLAHALLTAEHHGVLATVLTDLQLDFPHDDVPHAAAAATKAWRFVDEMTEIAATQAGAELTPELFAAMAEVYRRLATSEWGARRPEDVPADLASPAGLRPRPAGD